MYSPSEESILVILLKTISSTTHQVIRLRPNNYTVGRDPDCDIVVVDPYVSRKHARIFYKNGKWLIEDIGSRNGTFIDGEDIRGKEAVELKEGMEVIVGFSTLVVKSFEKS